MGWWPPFLGALVRKTLYVRLKPKRRPQEAT
jgi:hypothetical protein